MKRSGTKSEIKSDASGNAIRVIVRLRPLSDSEIARRDDKIVEVKDQSVKICDPTRATPELFSYDNVLGPSITQEQVFQSVGSSVVDNIFMGYNCCILAYGMTGSGKTHTMLGANDNPGLIPNICQHLFDRAKIDGIEVKCEISFIEIYGESVRDLLDRNAVLKIRNTDDGAFIQGLTTVAVANAEQIMKFIESGSKARSVAHTKCNESSSRSHAIFSIYWKQIKIIDGVRKRISSKINLVDLAGSEKINVSGVTGRALDEAIAINSSLSYLAKVIDELIKKSKHISFRNTPLTNILADSLAGNSKTTFLAAISPASSNFHQTRATLRYADQVKKIKTKAIVNEASDALDVELLRAEIESLKKQLADKESSNYDELVAQLASKEQQLKEETTAWETRLQESEQVNRKIIESITGQLQMSQSTTEEMKQQIFTLQQQIFTLQKQIIGMQDEGRAITQANELQTSKLKIQITALSEKYDQARQTLVDATTLHDQQISDILNQKNKHLAELTGQIVELQQKISDFTNEIKTKDDEIQQLRQQLETIVEENKRMYDEEIEQLAKEYSDDIGNIIGQATEQHSSSLGKLREAFRKRFKEQQEEQQRLKETQQHTIERLIDMHKAEINKYRGIIKDMEKKNEFLKTFSKVVKSGAEKLANITDEPPKMDRPTTTE